MKASFTTGLAFAFGIGLLTAGCGGGGSGGDGSYGGNGGSGGGMGTGTAPPPAMGATNFNAFVKEQFAQMSDTSDPIDMNDRQWEFNDDDETAFDDVL
jgi:hypothetical protein